MLPLEGGPVSPLRPLRQDGQRLWDDVFSQGQLWVSGRTDTQLLQLVCEQIDRRAFLMAGLIDNPTERSIHMSLNDVEKLISGNLSLLGFTPSDRSRLGVAEVRAYLRTRFRQWSQRRHGDTRAATQRLIGCPKRVSKTPWCVFFLVGLTGFEPATP